VTSPPDEPREVLRIERTFEAPAVEVFEAWTSPETLKRWYHAEHHWETPEAEVDLRVGGRVRVVMRNPEDGAEYGGEGAYTVIDPPRRLAFTWRWDDDDESLVQLIELEFIDHGATTTVVMINSRLRKEDVEDHREGWQNSFDNLDRALAA
jgi:uncharacterized protein YndB with AHSA1/START domain